MLVQLSGIFSIYIDIVVLCIGLYMALVQSRNLSQIDKLHREGCFTKVVGYIYIIVAVMGFILTAL